MIISFILVTLMCDSRMILSGEVRCRSLFEYKRIVLYYPELNVVNDKSHVGVEQPKAIRRIECTETSQMASL